MLLAGIIFAAFNIPEKSVADKESWIKPWKENPRYWQYKEQPVLLLGGTCDDNLFQNANLESHLDSLQVIGGNYIRNTMSDRDTGDERAYAKTSDGEYDLNKGDGEIGSCKA